MLLVKTPYGIFASDNRYADVAGDDGIPEMAVGRLPVLTDEELENLIADITNYESTSRGWKESIMLLADNPDEDGNFPGDSNVIAGLIPFDYSKDK